jgi:hypothetical protein
MHDLIIYRGLFGSENMCEITKQTNIFTLDIEILCITYPIHY